jgi:CHAT domain-containing protein
VLLQKLADQLAATHKDLWLKDFLSGPHSETANRLLSRAMHLNHLGDSDHAFRNALSAEWLFAGAGNTAGAARSRFEQIYALRRESNAKQCLSRGAHISDVLATRRYYWIQIQTEMELSSCEFMANRHDRSRAFSTRALSIASNARYSNLYLRALSLKAALQMQDGRTEATWRTNTSGLGLFWKGLFPGERAFQFYHDLHFDSDSAGMHYLAFLLQRETLSMIAGHGRYDFEALAHFQMAEAAEMLGDRADAEQEFRDCRKIMGMIPASSEARRIYEAYIEIGFAQLSIHSGLTSEAAGHLAKASPFVENADNAALRLQYLQAVSEFHRALLNVAAEKRDLERIAGIVEQQLRHTASLVDRWYMAQELDRARRRFLEIVLSEDHHPSRALAMWQSWKAAPMNFSAVHSEKSPRRVPGDWINVFPAETFVSFAVLPHSVITWVVDDSGIKEKTTAVEEPTLRRLVRKYYSLCSDPHTDLKKVNVYGSRLYEMLIAPLHIEPNTQEIRISTDSFLSFIPWSALRMPDGRYWGMTQPLVIDLHSNSERKNRMRAFRLRRMLVATPAAADLDGRVFLPLPQAKQESSYIQELYPDSKLLSAGHADTSHLFAELSKADGLHFAGHAINRQIGGGLITDPEGGSPFLTADEIRKHRMPNLKVVVLSACSTASPGEGADQNPDGLVQAFVSSGVSVVIATRWDLESSPTTELMEIFYRLLKSGLSPTEALEHAIDVFSSRNGHMHPYYWSSFQVFESN